MPKVSWKHVRPWLSKCMWKEMGKPLNNDGEATLNAFLPPQGLPGRLLTSLWVSVMLYGLLYVATGRSDSMLPPKNCTPAFTSRVGNVSSAVQCTGGQLFGLYILYVLTMSAGYLVSHFRLPPLIGMFAVAVLLRNVPVLYVNLIAGIDRTWASFFRNMALSMLIIRAGVGLNPANVRRLILILVRFVPTPFAIEAACGAVMAHYLLGLPWLWSFVMGFMLGAVSTAVIVPSMLKFEQRGYDPDKNVTTLSLATACLENVLAVTMSSLMLSLIFSTWPLWLVILMCPLGMIIGGIYGCTAGVLLWFIPYQNQRFFLFYRFILLVGMGMFSVIGSGALQIYSAGSIGCFATAFVASWGWRRREGWVDRQTNPLVAPLDTLWWVAQPFLFGLTGSAMDFAALPPVLAGKELACIFGPLVVRLTITFICLFGTHLNYKERLFITLEWFSKATVQAAIAARALDATLTSSNSPPEFVEYANLIINMAVLSILVTAPVGVLLVTFAGPLLLSRKSPASTDQSATVMTNGNGVELQTSNNQHLTHHPLPQTQSNRYSPPTVFEGYLGEERS